MNQSATQEARRKNEAALEKIRLRVAADDDQIHGRTRIQFVRSIHSPNSSDSGARRENVQSQVLMIVGSDER